ncbi:hypothetical protein, partial [Geothrix campi]|uniref:hypothetical protein n=1 Tax=Geothrix campi TaxID=2966450 RepID=UPI00214939E7
MKRLVLCASLITFGCSSPDTTMESRSMPGTNWGTVVVWNREFKLISKINAPDDLIALSEIWNTRKKASPQY